ncbi:hypothetical protein E2C01_073563 [Portunus trituberculatus]|uniref:Uncharacterized protein n=1 Tax=Portunus trituberculatus TaxID=210409 RepID=A0A5B7I102_PORTR|nr:hypothetical protein [Portunus trituberculatus]
MVLDGEEVPETDALLPVLRIKSVAFGEHCVHHALPVCLLPCSPVPLPARLPACLKGDPDQPGIQADQ